jgi:hypothetical protein
MKVTFVTAVWKRPEVFALFAKGIHELIRLNPDVQIEVCVSGSEGFKSEKMVTDEGFKYVEVPNDPLGRKMNSASILARQTDANYYVLVGSDDVVHNDLFQLYLKMMKNGFEYIYLIDCFFYDMQSDKSLFWAGYDTDANRGHALGAGRVLSKAVMHRIGFKCWYDNKLNGVLDTAFDRIVEPVIQSRVELSCAKDNVHILDIKSGTNMTKFDLWRNSKMINNSIIKEKFSFLWN